MNFIYFKYVFIYSSFHYYIGDKMSFVQLKFSQEKSCKDEFEIDQNDI